MEIDEEVGDGAGRPAGLHDTNTSSLFLRHSPMWYAGTDTLPGLPVPVPVPVRVRIGFSFSAGLAHALIFLTTPTRIVLLPLSPSTHVLSPHLRPFSRT